MPGNRDGARLYLRADYDEKEIVWRIIPRPRAVPGAAAIKDLLALVSHGVADLGCKRGDLSRPPAFEGNRACRGVRSLRETR